MEISLFEVDTSFIPTPFISVTLWERGLRGSVHGRGGSSSGSCPQEVPVSWLWVSLLFMGALGKWFFGVQGLLQPSLGSNSATALLPQGCKLVALHA